MTGARVLVVEDEFIIALDIDRILEGAGVAHVRHASSVGDALAFLDMVAAGRETIRIAVVDLKLDRESALPVAVRLATLGVPFVFLTGSPETSEARAFPDVEIVAKPFDEAALVAALRQTLGGS